MNTIMRNSCGKMIMNLIYISTRTVLTIIYCRLFIRVGILSSIVG